MRKTGRNGKLETRTLDIPVIMPAYYEDCLQCMERLREALLSLEGVHRVDLDVESSTVELTYDSNYLTLESVEKQARQIGIRIAESYNHEVIRLVGLDCPDCAIKLEKGVGRVRGVVSASVNYASSLLSVEYEAERTDREDIIRAVRRFGYNVDEERPAQGVTAGQVSALRPAWANSRVIVTVMAGMFIAAALIAGLLQAPALVARLLYGFAILLGGYYPARSGLYSLRNLVLDINLLVSVAAIGAVALDDFFEAAMVLFLFSLGSALESYTVDKTRRSIRGLLDLSPPYAVVKRNGTEALLPVEEVGIGDVVIVKPGERISMDGIVSAGVSSVDQAPITGESVPIEKNVGSEVYAGTINGHGALEIEVTRLVGDNTLSRIIHLVEEAQSKKAPSQRFAERFGRIYTPIVLGSAVLLAFIPSLLFDAEFAEWFRRSLILLVVACPCALVISTPVAVVAAIGNAARKGVLIKGGAYLEELGRVSAVAFDKTGTLTTGQLAVTDILPLDDVSPREILAAAAAVESRSEHPLADSIIRKAREEGIEPDEVSYFEALPGRGARAIVDGNVYYVGNHKLLDELSVPLPRLEDVAALWDAGKTLVYVGVEDRVLGVIAAADKVKETSAAAIEQLRQSGVRRIVMLTGDNAATARSIAKSLGIDEVHAELLPEDKVEAVRGLVRQYGKVAMVGDGINDAPALAAASVGIAMGGAGTHAALETADIALAADDLSMLPYGIALSRRTLKVIRQNVAFALFVVVLLISSTLIGWLTLTGGVLGHEGSALLVIANSMRLLPRRTG